jgi:hypothetical protein
MVTIYDADDNIDYRNDLKYTNYTPWGRTQTVRKIADGILQYSTAGHGGIKVKAKLNNMIHPEWRNADGWYEEDVCWAIVAFTFPQFFIKHQGQAASTLKNYYPHQYMKVTGEIIKEGESHQLDKELFTAKNVGKFIVFSALTCADDRSMVVCYAQDVWGVSKKFIVPASEYEQRSKFGFVIDLDKHKEINS